MWLTFNCFTYFFPISLILLQHFFPIFPVFFWSHRLCASCHEPEGIFLFHVFLWTMPVLCRQKLHLYPVYKILWCKSAEWNKPVFIHKHGNKCCSAKFLFKYSISFIFILFFFCTIRKGCWHILNLPTSVNLRIFYPFSAEINRLFSARC